MKKILIIVFTILLIVGAVLLLIIFIPNRNNFDSSNQPTAPSSFTLISEWTGTNGEVIKSLYLDSNYLYAAAGFDGLMIFDPTNLNLIGSFSTNYPFQDLIVKSVSSNKYAVAVLGSFIGKGGLLILDVTDPTNIYLTNILISNDISGYAFASYPEGYDINNDAGVNIYTADQTKGCQGYTIDWNSFMITLGKSISIKTNTSVNLLIYQQYGYLAAKDNGMFIIDLSGEKILSQMKTSISYINSMAIKNKTLIVADKMNGILFYKLEKPEKPVLIENYDTPGDANEVLPVGNDIYIADGINGVLKIKHPAQGNFILEKQFNDRSMAYKILYSKITGYLYVTCGKDGIRIIE